MNIIKKIKKLCYKAITKKNKKLLNLLKEEEINISVSKNLKISHFQFNDSMKLSKILNITPINIANKIKKYIEIKKNIFEEIIITQPGFVNFKIKKNYIITKLITILKSHRNNIKKTKKKLNIIVDYSSPNIAKEMHVGHLRSTIIGDFIANILEYNGNNVFRINHLGDWGTQFGMLIAYLKKYCKKKTLTIKNLSEIYVKSQNKFKTNKKFEIKSKNEVIKLQNGNKKSIKIWKKINLLSQKEYNKIYKILNVKLINIGESFYKNTIKKVISCLYMKNMIENSDSAKCIKINDKKKYDSEPPIIIQKSDGGYNYSTTEIAALYYRINIQKADWIIYVTDIGQADHFEMIINLAKKAQFLKEKTKITHIKFGLMLEKNGKKIKTRSGNAKKLIDLIATSINKAKKIIKEKNTIKSKINLKAKILGINSIKYADLSSNIQQNYKFEINKMLNFNGNTASFIMYAYARIISIQKKFKKTRIKNIIKNANLNLTNEIEINICLHLIQYEEIINRTISTLNPNILTNYIYKLSEKFHVFFHSCKVINSEFENSRILICEISRKIIKQALKLLGLKIMNEM